MPLLTSIEHLTQDWAALVARHPSGQPLPQQDVLQLVVRHLGPPGSDLEPAQLNDTPAVHPPPPAATSNDAHPPPPAAAASSNGKSDTAAGAAAAAAADKKTAAAEAGTHEAGCSGGGGGSQHVGLPPPSPPPPPPWLEALTSQELRSWAAHLIGLWPVLARRVSAATAKRPQCHTLLPLPRPFVAPGDRFRECYYWDSYWVVRGLLVCGMASTATAIVDNLLHLLQAHGYVPNGGRSYYLNR